jgi:hypothetical protein
MKGFNAKTDKNPSSPGAFTRDSAPAACRDCGKRMEAVS